MSSPESVHFGRNAGVEGPRRRLGLWSLLCALLAFSLVVAALVFMINLPTDASEMATNVATMAMVTAYFLVAPVLHVTGVVLGIIGLSRGGESKLRCVIGILLNIALLASGVVLGLVAIQGIGAFT